MPRRQDYWPDASKEKCLSCPLRIVRYIRRQRFRGDSKLCFIFSPQRAFFVGNGEEHGGCGVNIVGFSRKYISRS